MSLNFKLKSKGFIEALESNDLDTEDLHVSGSFEGEKQEISIDMSVTADVVARYGFIASETEKVTKIKEIHGTPEQTSTATYLQVERLQGTEDFGEGDDLIQGDGFDLTATADTIQEATLVESSAVSLDENDRLAIVIDGATNEISQVLVEVEVKETIK